MTKYLPQNASDLLFINISDINRIENADIKNLRDCYKYCKENYYKLSNTNLWTIQYGLHTLIYDLSKVIDDILEKQLLICVEEFEKFIKAHRNDENFTMKEVKKEMDDFTKEYNKKSKSLTTATYIKTLINFFTHKISDDNFIDNINMNNKYMIPLIDMNYNIKTRKLEERKGNQNFTKCFNIDSTAFKTTKINEDDYKLVDKFFFSIANNNEEKKNYLQKIFGYCITGDINARNFFIFYGEGSNGKSAVIEIFQALMGQFCKTVEPSIMISRGKKAGGVASPEMVALDLGTRIGILSEVDEEDELNETLLKNISGGDKIAYRTLFKNEYKEFVSEAKCIILTNHKPKCSASQSMLDRIRYIDFNARFTSSPKEGEIKRDPEAVLKLKTELLPMVLRWCLDGTKQYLEHGLVIPESLKVENDSYGIESNSFEKFLKERTESGCDFTVSKSNLYMDYEIFCKDDKIKKTLKKSDFNYRLVKKYGEAYKTNGIECYKGFRIKIDNGDDVNDLDR